MGPIMDAAGFQLLAGVLPEELAVGFAKGDEDTSVTLLLRVVEALVVGAYEDLAAYYYRVAVGGGAQLGHPGNVLHGIGVPLGGGAGHVGDHVAVLECCRGGRVLSPGPTFPEPRGEVAVKPVHGVEAEVAFAHCGTSLPPGSRSTTRARSAIRATSWPE